MYDNENSSALNINDMSTGKAAAVGFKSGVAVTTLYTTVAVGMLGILGLGATCIRLYESRQNRRRLRDEKRLKVLDLTVSDPLANFSDPLADFSKRVDDRKVKHFVSIV
jgi:hypothetical protein